MTPDQAKQLGWAITVSGKNAVAVNEKEKRKFDVTSDIPFFSALRQISEIEGQGEMPVDPADVLATTGEVYVVPVVVEPPPQTTISGTLKNVKDGANVTKEQLASALATLFPTLTP